MSTSGHAARVAAAAFVLGVNLGSACSLPVASADSPDTSVSAGTSDGAGASRPARAAKSAVRRTGQNSPPAAAAGSTRARRGTATVQAAPPRAARSTTAAVAPAPVQPVAGPAAAVPTGVFGPVGSLVEGGALLVRRAFSRQSLTVNPVQLTGQTEGPITGTIGVVDNGRGRITYTVTADPLYGTVTIGPDGGYDYTPGTEFAGTDSFIVTVAKYRLLNTKRPKTTEASVAVSQGALAPLLQFQFVYGDGAKYWTPEARSSLETAGKQLAQYFVVTSPVTITYSVTGERKPLSGTLASAGSDFIDPEKTGFVQTVVQNKIQTGVDSNGSDPDGEITWNFGPRWGYGNAVGNTEYDFESTAMHELTHTLGFLSYVDKPGNNRGKTWTVFDSFLVNDQGTTVINGDYTWNTDYNANLTGGNGGLFFGGPNAVAAYNGPVPLYTPSPWSSGSSMSHLDDAVFTGRNEKLMNAVSGSGLGIRVLSPAELGILADIGYQITPGTSTLMFIGLFGLRRLRKKD